MHMSRARTLWAATGSVIQPLEARRLLSTSVNASGAVPLLMPLPPPPPPPSGSTIYVDMTATGSASGMDWDDAFPTLQAAIAVSVSGDQIDVAQNIPNEPYTPGANRTDTFQLIDGVTIQGGYDGLAADSTPGASRDDQNPVAYPTILSGDIGSVGDNSDNSYHVVTGSNTDATAVLDSVTISDGNADGSGDSDSAQGAGMLNNAGSPTISNCIFTNNFASNYGGGMFDENGASPTLTSCAFTQNTSDQGGAMANVSSDFNNECAPQITACTFTSNDGGSSGGAIYNFLSGGSIESCTFQQNAAQYLTGGAIFELDSIPFIYNCTFSQNSAVGNGGAIYDASGDATIQGDTLVGNSSDEDGGAIDIESFGRILQCTFEQNTASASGGAANIGGDADLTNCLFEGNTAGNGGAVSADPNFGAGPTLADCAFVGNSANNGSNGDGGAIANDNDGDILLINCTFTANNASGFGAAIYNTNSSPEITNSIFWQNTSTFNSSEPIDDSDSNSSSVVTFSDVSGVGSPNDHDNFNTDPLFVTAPSAGTDGVWGTSDDDYGNLELQFTSPCIDKGDTNAINQTSTYTDLVGNNRVDGGIVDLGAYEAQIFFVAPTFQGSGTGDDWADAADIRSVLENAPAGSLIKVSQGTYDGGYFQIPSGMIVQGGYAGPGTVNPDQRDLTHFISTLDGQGTAEHVVSFYEADASTVLDGFTITGGNANGPLDGNNDVGGGIFNDSGSPTIENCIITNNSAEYDSGMFNTGRNATCAPTLTNCTFSDDNNAAMGNESASVTMIGCVFTNNTSSTGSAAGMNSDGGDLNLTDCTFTNNQNTYNGGGGGAIDEFGGGLELTDCTFTSNSASSGGAVGFDANDLTVVNCLFANNTATGSTQYGVDPGRGGAISIDDFPYVSFTNCTFTGNTAQMSGSEGGAVYEVTANPVFTNCILWNDSASMGSEIYDDPARNDGSTVNNSDIDGGFAGTGTGNINADPNFVDPTDGNYQLQSGSPAIDAGDDNAVTTSTDLAGNQRIQGAHVDMGAYEATPFSFGAYSTSLTLATSAPSVDFFLNSDVNESTIDPSDVTINVVNADGSLGASVSAVSFIYDPGVRKLRFHLPTTLADNNYQASLSAGVMQDDSGDSNVASTPFDFFFLAGDANHDRIVNALDFNALATNYGKSGIGNPADFDYSGSVDSNDFDILAGKFGTSLAKPTGFTGMALPALSATPSASLFSSSPITTNDQLLDDPATI